MQDYTEQALHLRAADFYDQIAITDPDEWSGVNDLTSQLHAFDHRILGHDYSGAAKLVDDVSFHLLAWGHYDRLIGMRERLKARVDGEDSIESLEPARIVKNEGGLGLAHLFKGNPHESSDFFMRAWLDAKMQLGKSDIETDVRDELKKAESQWLGYLGGSKAYAGGIDEAQQLFRDAHKVAQKAGDKFHAAFWQMQVGWLDLDYYRDNMAAHDNLSKAVKVLDKLGSSETHGQQRVYFYPRWGMSHADLGRACAQLGLFDEADKNFLKAVEILSKVDDRRGGRGVLPGSIGSCLRERGFPNEARSLYELALVNQKEIGDLRGEQITCARLGNVHRDLAWQAFLAGDGDRASAESELQSAIKNFDRSVNLAREGRDLRRLKTGLRRLGNAHRELYRFCKGAKGKGDKRAKALELARSYHDEAMRLAPETYVANSGSTDGKSRDKAREDRYDWLEHTRIAIEDVSSGSTHPQVTQDLVDQKKAEIPIAMGVALLRVSDAYDGQGHKIKTPKDAFASAKKFAAAEKKALSDGKSKTKNFRRQLELDYLAATAEAGLAVAAQEDSRAAHRGNAETQFNSLVSKYPSPSVIRDACLTLLMMEDALDRTKDASKVDAIKSVRGVLSGGLAYKSPEGGSNERKLFDKCRKLFPVDGAAA